MTTRTGLDAQIGFAEEVTVGTRVAPNRWLPFDSETMQLSIDRIESDGIRSGRTVLDALDWAAGAKTVAGDITMDARTKDLGLFLKHGLGAVATAGAGPYTHTFTPGDLFGKGLTVQVGRPDTTGTVRPFEYAGCKISSFTLSADVDDILKLGLSLVGTDESTAQSLGTPSYTAASTLFTFVHGALTIGGTAVPVMSVELSVENGLQDARHRLGSATTTEQRQNERREIMLTAEADFQGLTEYNRFVSGATAAAVLTFTSGTDVLTVTLNVRFDGETPTVAGVDEIPLSLSMKAVGTSDANACTITLVNGQATP